MSQTVASETDDRETLKLSDYRKLSVDDRIRLVRNICESIAEDTVGSNELPDWQKRELDQALEEYAANPEEGSEWAEVEARIRAGIRES
jgi:putative addiction module component (TIGR02574 family)